MEEPKPNVKAPPEEPALRRLYEEPHSVRERHYGLMTRGGTEREAPDDRD